MSSYGNKVMACVAGENRAVKMYTVNNSKKTGGGGDAVKPPKTGGATLILFKCTGVRHRNAVYFWKREAYTCPLKKVG